MKPIDWHSVIGFDTHPLEIIVRGTIVYLTLFLIFRVVVKRHAGAMGIPDLLLVVLVADAVQNAMAGSYESVGDGLLLVCTILFWSHVLDWLAFRTPILARLLEPPPIPLIRDGKVNFRNMRRELITEDELKSHLREEGIESTAQVKLAFMEPDGQVSIVPYDQPTPANSSKRKRGPA